MVLIGFSDTLSLTQSIGNSRNNGPDSRFFEEANTGSITAVNSENTSLSLVNGRNQLVVGGVARVQNTESVNMGLSRFTNFS